MLFSLCLVTFSGRSSTARRTAAPFRRTYSRQLQLTMHCGDLLTRAVYRLGWATTSADASSFPNDPADAEAQKYLEEGTKILEDGDVDSAKVMYLRSVEIKKTAGVSLLRHNLH